jgi:uncharacterized LabA/DUF88 family protein
MPTPKVTTAALAILIDADNASAVVIKGLLEEVAKLGRATVRRIYGDWTKPNLAPWKEVLLAHSIQPIQQFAYTTGKNSTDSAMIIDAMDLLYAGNLDGFCLVSSDSDFTRLASRLKESGKLVYGFGEEKKTPDALVAACDRFIYTEVFAKVDGQAPSRKSSAELDGDREFVELVGGAIDDAAEENGWANLSEVGNLMAKKSPAFDPRNYGYKRLSDLVEAAVKHFTANRTEKGVLVSRTKNSR